MPAASIALRNTVVHDDVFLMLALLASPRQHLLHLEHPFAATWRKPPPLLPEDSSDGLESFADIFPLVETILARGTFIICNIAVHHNPPFRPPVVSGAVHNHTRNQCAEGGGRTHKSRLELTTF